MSEKQPISCIHPIHHSMQPTGVRKPNNMDTIRIPGETPEEINNNIAGLTQVAIDIFTDCVNVGTPFQNSLLAIYLSGLQHGAALSKPDTKVNSLNVTQYLKAQDFG